MPITSTPLPRFDEAVRPQAVHAESKLDFERLKYKRSKEMKHAKKRKRVRAPRKKSGGGAVTRQGNTQFLRSKSGNPAGDQGLQEFQHHHPWRPLVTRHCDELMEKTKDFEDTGDGDAARDKAASGNQAAMGKFPTC